MERFLGFSVKNVNRFYEKEYVIGYSRSSLLQHLYAVVDVVLIDALRPTLQNAHLYLKLFASKFQLGSVQNSFYQIQNHVLDESETLSTGQSAGAYRI